MRLFVYRVVSMLDPEISRVVGTEETRCLKIFGKAMVCRAVSTVVCSWSVGVGTARPRESHRVMEETSNLRTLHSSAHDNTKLFADKYHLTLQTRCVGPKRLVFRCGSAIGSESPAFAWRSLHVDIPLYSAETLPCPTQQSVYALNMP